MKADKADKIIKKAELKAKKAALQVEAAGKKAEKTRQKQAAQAQKKATKAAAAATKKAAAKTKKAEAAAKKAQVAAQKAEAKKEKALAKAAAKASVAPGGGDEGGEVSAAPKKKGKKKLLLIAAPVLAVAVGAGVYFFFLRGGGEEEEGPPEPIAIPTEYVYVEEGEPVVALPVWGEEVLVYREELTPAPAAEPEDAATLSDKGEEDGDAEPAEAKPEADEEEGYTKILYRYEGLKSPVDLISAYAALMTTEDAGFSNVDDTLLRVDLPEEFGASGTVLLARNSTEGTQAMLLSWGETECSVTLDMPEGKVHDPKPETSGGGFGGQPRRGLSDLQAMHPSKLGLAGDSMEAYELMPQEGSVRIAGSVCARVNIYNKSNGQVAGIFFLSGDGKLYKLEEELNAVVELDWE